MSNVEWCFVIGQRVQEIVPFLTQALVRQVFEQVGKGSSGSRFVLRLNLDLTVVIGVPNSSIQTSFLGPNHCREGVAHR